MNIILHASLLVSTLLLYSSTSLLLYGPYSFYLPVHILRVGVGGRFAITKSCNIAAAFTNGTKVTQFLRESELTVGYRVD